MEINRSNINELVNKCSVKPDKDYGQNFLVEPLIAEKIVDALEVNNDDYVLEIGPGLGSLTHFLYQKSKLDVCDIDSRMIDFLKIFYKEDINYILNDVRKIDVSSYSKIIGNLPYNITTELVTFLLMNSNAKRMILMCQSEAFNRFYDLEGENYGPVSVMLHLLGTPKKILTVKPGSFYPAPKCNSLVFSFDLEPVIDKETVIKVYKMCKSIFLNRRKTILNNLSHLVNKDKASLILKELNIEENRRPETISPTEYLQMFVLVNK